MREKMEKLRSEMEEMAGRMSREFASEMARREEFMKHPLVKAPEGKVIKVKINK